MTNDFTKFFADLPNPFAVDQKMVEQNIAAWTGFSEKMSGIAFDAAAAGHEIASTSTRESLANLRNMTAVREPAEYGQAFGDFAQKQADLAMRTAEAFGGVVRSAQTDAAQLMTEAGETMTKDVTANVNSATKTTKRKAA